MVGYKAKKHLEDFSLQYIAMFLLLALGLSSGMWFYSMTGSDFFCSGAVVLMRCKSILFWECFFMIFSRYLLICIILLICSVNKLASVLGYLIIFICGVSLGETMFIGFACGILRGIIMFTVQLGFSFVAMYLNAINNCSNNLLAPSSGRLSRKGKIYASAFLLILLYSLITCFVVLFFNLYL